MNTDIFKTTLYKTIFNNKLVKKELLNILKRCKEQNILNNISNIGGYQTKSYSSPTFDKYFEKPINNYLKTLKFRKPIKWYITSLWINENNNNDYNKPHTHIDPKNHFACVWYLEVPKNSGNLIFLNEKGFSSIGQSDLFNLLDDPIAYTNYTVVPKKNLFIMFPASTIHYVEMNRSNKKRISVAFNIGFFNN